MERRAEIREVNRGQIPKGSVNLNEKSEIHSKGNEEHCELLSSNDRQHGGDEKKDTSYMLLPELLQEDNGPNKM